MRKIFIGFAVAAALSGCADLNKSLQSVNDSLKSLNGALAGAGSSSLQVGDSSGYRPTINVAVPGNVCNSAAFQDGAMVGYVNSWNQLIHDRGTMWKLRVQAGGGTVAKNNAKLYANKAIGTAGLPLESNYQMQLGSTANNCNFNSFTQGKNAGINASMSDYNAIVKDELPQA